MVWVQIDRHFPQRSSILNLFVGLGLCLTLLVLNPLWAESYYPIHVDDSDRVELRGSQQTDIRLRTVYGNQNLDEAIVQVFECTKSWPICALLTEAERHSDGTYRMRVPRTHLALTLRIIDEDHGVISMELPHTHSGEIDMGSVDFQGLSNLEDIKYFFGSELEGVVLDEDGKPLEGIRVKNFGPHGGNFDRSFVATYTDEKGSFNIWHTGHAARVSLYGHDGSRFELHEDTPNVAIEAGGLFRITLETAEEIDIVTRGKPLDQVAFSLYSLFPYSKDKIPISTLKRRFTSPETLAPEWLLAHADGHLARLIQYPSRESPLRVDFSQDKPISIKVTSGGAPVEGARIHVFEAFSGYLSPTEFPGDRSQEIDMLVSTEDGQSSSMGDPNTSYVAMIVAEGFAPKATLLRFGATNEVDLDSINSQVELRGVQTGETVKIMVKGTDELAIYWKVEDRNKKLVQLAPGIYDATVASKSGEVVRGTTLELGGHPTSIDLSTDTRPLLKLDLPVLPAIPARVKSYSSEIPDTDQWVATITRDMPWGGVSGAMAISYHGRPPLAFYEPPTRIDIPSGGIGSVRLPGTGRWFVQLAARYRSIEYWLFSEIDVSSGETIELSLPPLSGKLVGSVDFYKEASEYFFYHGIASPRMMLLPQNRLTDGWTMVLSGLNNDNNDSGRLFLDHLVPGEYRLEHFLNKAAGGNWGGYKVNVQDGQVTEVGNLSRELAKSVRIDVVNDKGKHVNGAVLHIKNRMYDAWDRFTELPTTGVYAGFPLQKPPSRVLQGKTVETYGVQEGLLELMVEDALGVNHHYLVEVSESRRIRLVLP